MFCGAERVCASSGQVLKAERNVPSYEFGSDCIWEKPIRERQGYKIEGNV